MPQTPTVKLNISKLEQATARACRLGCRWMDTRNKAKQTQSCLYDILSVMVEQTGIEP